MTRTRTYSELSLIDTFEDRYKYLALRGGVGVATFGYDRWMNQDFYTGREWRHIRNHVIARDSSCDLGVVGNDIYDRVYVHHMNPLTPEQLVDGDENALDPEFLICVTHRTHNAIHFGDESQLPRPLVVRRPGDTTPWRE